MGILAFLRARRLASQLMDGEGASRRKALDRIRELGEGAASVPEILAAECAPASDPSKKARAVRALADVVRWVRGDAKKVVPALVSALEHQERAVQRPAAEALGEYGAAAQGAIPALVKALARPEAAEAAARALSSITALDRLPEEARFRAYLSMGNSSRHIEALEEAARMGPRFLPLLEEWLLALEPSEYAASYGGLGTEGPRLFMNTVYVYDQLGAVPSGRLRDKLIRWALDKDLRATPDESEVKDIARRVLQRGSGIGLDDHIAWIRGPSRSLQGQAIEACWYQPPTERRDEIVEALVAVAQNPGRNQVQAIECLGRFGSDARAALPALESITAAAKRAVTTDDFREQEQLLGGLTPGILDRVVSRTPVDPEALAAAVEAIRRITAE